jgi:hypothetical protein
MDRPIDRGTTGDPTPTPRLRAAELSEAERDADTWARTIIDARLARMRELATQWGATISALTALFGTGVIIDADDAVRALDPAAWSIAYGALAGLALGLAAFAIYAASSAAQAQVVSIPPGAPERLRLQNELVSTAVSRLRRSRILGALAIIVLLASFAVRWYAPVKPELQTPPAATSALGSIREVC